MLYIKLTSSNPQQGRCAHHTTSWECVHSCTSLHYLRWCFYSPPNSSHEKSNLCKVSVQIWEALQRHIVLFHDGKCYSWMAISIWLCWIQGILCYSLLLYGFSGFVYGGVRLCRGVVWERDQTILGYPPLGISSYSGLFIFFLSSSPYSSVGRGTHFWGGFYLQQGLLRAYITPKAHQLPCELELAFEGGKMAMEIWEVSLLHCWKVIYQE